MIFTPCDMNNHVMCIGELTANLTFECDCPCHEETE